MAAPIKAALTALAAVAFAACSHAGSAVPGAPGQPAPGQRVHATLRIVVPPHARKRRDRRPAYVSPSTASLSYAVDGGTPSTVDIVPANPNECSSSVSGSLVCQVSIVAPPGQHTFSFTAYDANGHALSGNTNALETLTPGIANTIDVTLGGIAASIVVTPPNVPQVAGTQGSGFTVFGYNHPLTFTIVAEDADNNVIVGPGTPSIQFSPNPSHVTVATPGPRAPNAWTLTSTYQATDPGVGASTTISLLATPVPNSGGTNVIASIPLSLNQSWFYVANCSGGGITTYSDAGTSTAPSPGFPSSVSSYGIAYDPSNGWVYSTPAYNVTAYNRLGTAQSFSGASPFSAVDGNATGVVYDPHDSYVYAVAYNNVGAGYDQQGNSEVTGFANLNKPFGIAFDSHNDELYVANYGTLLNSAAGITVYNEAGVQQTPAGGTFPGTDAPEGIAFDPHDDLIYVANYSGGITVYNEDGSAATVSGTFAGTNAPGGVAFDPHDNMIYVANYGNASVTAYDEEGDMVTSFSAVTGSIALAIVP